MEGIVMEVDCPSNNEDSRMPILDMKVWMGEDSTILYKHYEKKVASKQILHAQSAQSSMCKRNVHKMEIVRRLLNTSNKLDWKEYAVPCLNEDMKWMQVSGYDETYRKNVLKQGLGIGI